MAIIQFRVQVLNISPKATPEDLLMFFSYCGTVDNIHIQRDGNQSQLAVVTFKLHYPVQLALLLDNSIIVDHQVNILPLEYGCMPIIVCTSENMQTEENKELGCSDEFSGHN